MDPMTELGKLDFPTLFIGVFLLLSAIISAASIIGKFSELIGKPVRWIRRKNQDHELLLKTIRLVAALEEKHNRDIQESNDHDAEIKHNIHAVSIKIDDIMEQITTMQQVIDETELAKLKDAIVNYYKKYGSLKEWTQFESDAFWGLYDRYISHGGNSFVKNAIKPVMEALKITD